jgi:hypothetical protein
MRRINQKKSMSNDVSAASTTGSCHRSFEKA